MINAMRIRWFFLVAMGLLISCRPQAGTLPDFTEMVEKHGPAVVNISTVQKASGKEQLQQRVPEFFRRFFDDLEDQFEIPRPEHESLGSGFIIESDGYILTNYHVVMNASEIIVRLQDRRELEAELVGGDPQSDIALLKVDAEGLPTVEIGSSADLKVGEWVLAIGAPFGFESTVTAGIVSAKGRSLPNENYVPFIQTDVAINPGNSGGPLFNLDGEVVGINSQIVSRSGGFMGLSFAIPVDMVMDVVGQLKKDGKVSRGWLGVLIQGVDRDLAESFGLDKPVGALVARVMPDSPAAEAGFQAGDVVLSFAGKPVEVSSELPHIVGRVEPGTEVEAKVLRDGKRVTLDVTVGELPEDMATAAPGRSAPEPRDSKKSSLGLVVAPLTGERQPDLDQGVRVTDVRPGPGASAGIRPGDVIVSLDNRPVADPEQFHDIASALEPGRTVPVLINRNGSPRFLALRLDAPSD